MNMNNTASQWIEAKENNYPAPGTAVVYKSEWIGEFTGKYSGTYYCEHDETTYHYFESKGGSWTVDTPTQFKLLQN